MSYKSAPRPATRSRMRELYDTIEGLGGANINDIVKYLPACSTSGKKRTRKDVKKGLYNGVYRGHFIVTPEGQYRIAPIEYYNQRNAYVKKLNNASNARRRKRRGNQQPAGHTVMRSTATAEPVNPPTTNEEAEFVIRIAPWIPPFVMGLIIGGMIASSILVMTGV